MKMGRTALLLLSLIILASVSGCPAPEEAPTVAKTAPAFQLRDLEGNLVALSDFRGRTVLVNFWATWCQPCVGEIPFLQKAHDELSRRGVTVLAVNIGESADKVQAFIRVFNYTFPVLQDSDAAAARDYRVTAIPTTFIIDPRGIIRAMKIGAFSGFAEIEETLAGISSR